MSPVLRMVKGPEGLLLLAAIRPVYRSGCVAGLVSRHLLAEGAAHRLLGDVMMAVQKKDQAQQHYQAAFLAYANIQPNASASLDSINRLTG